MAFAPRAKHEKGAALIGILNTRPQNQAAALSELLRKSGYEPLETPLVELRLEAESLMALMRAPLGSQDGFLISSPGLIPLLAEHTGAHIRALVTAKPWYLISGRAQAQAEALGARVAFAPQHPSLAGFLQEFPRRKNLRLLHLCSTHTRLDPDLFARHGIEVENLPVYAPACPAAAGAQLTAAWPRAQAVLFASGSAVHNLFAAVPQLGSTLDKPGTPRSVSIGPSAAEALMQHGVSHPMVAPTADNAGFLAALKTVFSHNPPF